MMDYESNENNPTFCFGVMSREFYYANMLIDAILTEDLAEVKRLLEVKKANPNTVVPERGVAPFHLIAGMENEDFSVPVALLMLVRSGGDPNIRSEDGLTPVHVSAMWGRCRMLEVLLSNGGDPYLKDDLLQLTAEDYALKEKQWRAYGLLGSHVVEAADDDRWAKYLEGQDDAWSGRGVEVGMTSRTEKKYDDLVGEDCDWVKKTMETLPLDEKSIRAIKDHRRRTRVYEYPPDSSSRDPFNEEAYGTVMNRRRKHLSKYPIARLDCSSNTGPTVPARNNERRGEEDVQESEEYFCGYAETSYRHTRPVGSTRYSSETSPLGSARVPNNKMLCKMSRIFLFMLKKRHIYQSIK